jgi:hypothetical protein
LFMRCSDTRWHEVAEGLRERGSMLVHPAVMRVCLQVVIPSKFRVARSLFRPENAQLIKMSLKMRVTQLRLQGSNPVQRGLEFQWRDRV